MEIRIKDKFIKDLKFLPKQIRDEVLKFVFTELPKSESSKTIHGLVKLSGFQKSGNKIFNI